jgi:hypothetical protein
LFCPHNAAAGGSELLTVSEAKVEESKGCVGISQEGGAMEKYLIPRLPDYQAAISDPARQLITGK